MKQFFSISLLILVEFAVAQPNCQAFLSEGDTLKYKACEVAKARLNHYQFSRYYQEALDKALAIDSTFAFAYRAKSTAYLKSGDFITWMQLMNQAVKYDPLGQLDYRGWCRYQFFRDYRGAIADIELLDSLVDYDIGYSVNGDYHLQIARALCYKALGKIHQAIDIIEANLDEDFPGPYDYLHLGVMYLETDQMNKAIATFEKQQEINDLAENHYYLALVYQQAGIQAKFDQHMMQAKEKYLEGYKLFDPYVEVMDQIYLEDIEAALADVQTQMD